MALVYLARSTWPTEVLLIAGYIPTTHQGLTRTITRAAPFSTHAAHIYSENDPIAAPGAVAALFCRHTHITAQPDDPHSPMQDQDAARRAQAWLNTTRETQPCPKEDEPQDAPQDGPQDAPQRAAEAPGQKRAQTQAIVAAVTVAAIATAAVAVIAENKRRAAAALEKTSEIVFF